MAISSATTYLPSNFTGTHREKLQGEILRFFELNAPTEAWMQRATEKDGQITPFGITLPFISQRPGGHSFYTMASASFQNPVPADTDKMFAAAVGYALPMQIHGRALRALRKGTGPDAKLSYQQVLALSVEEATKRINQINYGDRTGALAFSSATLGSTGSGQTLTCSTTAAATAGQTKGAVRLTKNSYFNAINASTEAIRGTFKVEAEGTASCTVNVTSGTVSSGDPIVDVSAYKRAWPGFAHIFGNHTRDLQGRDTSVDTQLNDPTVDLNGAAITPAAWQDAKTAIRVRNNDRESAKGLVAFMTNGLYSVLCKQGYGFKIYINGNGGKHTGMPETYEDGDTQIITDDDCDDDRVYIFNPMGVKMLVEKELGLFDDDGNEWRMWFGDNDAGSDVYLRAIGTVRGIVKTKLRSAALIKRASLTGVQRQASGIF